MFFIPGWLISVATFPGVIVHEAAHFLFCRIYRLAIFKVCFFRIGNPAGYVIHEPSNNFTTVFMVGMGPFFVNTTLCIVFCSAAFIPVWELEVADPFSYFFYWLGISIGMHAFPSVTDLKHVWHLAPAEARSGNLLAIASFPLIALLVVLNYARFFWADLGYGVAVGILAPLAVFKALVWFFFRPAVQQGVLCEEGDGDNRHHQLLSRIEEREAASGHFQQGILVLRLRTPNGDPIVSQL